MKPPTTPAPVAPPVFFGVKPSKTMAMHHWCCELPDVEIYTLTEDIGARLFRISVSA
jgi:hypothetical protein